LKKKKKKKKKAHKMVEVEFFRGNSSEESLFDEPELQPFTDEILALPETIHGLRNQIKPYSPEPLAPEKIRVSIELLGPP
jgi:hypothetical protein